MEENEAMVNESTEDYIETIKELKANTVSRDEYLKLKADNKSLLNALASGQTMASTDAKVEKPSIEDLRKNFFKEDQTNLEYIQNALALREALIESGEPDPFVPQGQKIIATDEDHAAAERVANALKSCIEYADGDSAIFTNELQRITLDTAPIRRGR